MIGLFRIDSFSIIHFHFLHTALYCSIYYFQVILLFKLNICQNIYFTDIFVKYKICYIFSCSKTYFLRSVFQRKGTWWTFWRRRRGRSSSSPLPPAFKYLYLPPPLQLPLWCNPLQVPFIRPSSTSTFFLPSSTGSTEKSSDVHLPY